MFVEHRHEKESTLYFKQQQNTEMEIDKLRITFDKDKKEQVLNLLNRSVDSEGYIVEKSDTDQRVWTTDGEEIKVENFAGVRTGSEIFIKDSLPSLIELSKL